MKQIDKEEQEVADRLDKEAAKREQDIEKRLKDKISTAASADSAAGASFEAGSVEEFNVMRQMELQARRDAQQVVFEQQAAKERRESNRILSLMLNNQQERSQAERDKAQWDYYGPFQ